IVVFLDYDGTLSPIVNDPDRAYMSDAVFQFVRLNNIYYAGSHGMDISTPSVSLYYGNHKHQTGTIDEKGNDMVNFCPAQEFLPRIQTIKVMLQEITRGIKGAMVEDNKFCLSVHFRCVNEDNVVVLKEKVESAMKSYKDFRISEGKEVMEIRPNINWDKGLALQYLLDTLGFENSSEVLPIYIGDDKTDEDAFKMIKSIGRGFPIVVSSTPKETEALYSLRDPIEVMSFLIRLAKWKKDCGYKKSSLFGMFRRLIR
ncbi:putative trehalose-phosphate phosphatase j, partial [Quercus suber]